MTHCITLIPGDGIGPEVSAAAREVLEATGVEIEWEEVETGEEALRKYGTPLPDQVLDSIRRNKVALKAPITTPVGSGFRSVNVALRKELDLYVNLRPVKSIRGVPSRYQDIDLVIVRENTEDLYVGIERKIDEDTAEATKIITRKASERICRYAFEYAKRHRRRRVTAVHKANILKFTDGLFLEVFREVSKEYDVQSDDVIVDRMCMDLVRKPETFDVLVMPNLYGDIISDLCAGLVGGLGVVPGANIGEEAAVFEAVHGSAPRMVGQDRANPIALILSGIMMLEHIGEEGAAKRVRSAVERVVAEGRVVTPDLGGTAKNWEMADEIARTVRGESSPAHAV